MSNSPENATVDTEITEESSIAPNQRDIYASALHYVRTHPDSLSADTERTNTVPMSRSGPLTTFEATTPTTELDEDTAMSRGRARRATIATSNPIGRTQSASVNVTSRVPTGQQRPLLNKSDEVMANIQYTVGQLFGNENWVQDAEEKKRLAREDRLRMRRTLSVGDAISGPKSKEAGFWDKVKWKMGFSHVAVPPGYRQVWGGAGASGVAGIPH